MNRLASFGLALALASAPASAADLFGGYSNLRFDGGGVSGGALAATWPVAGSLGVSVQATAHFGLAQGEDLREWTLMAGPVFAPRRGHKLSPFLQLRGGLGRSRRQIEVFGVGIGPDGVCDGGCPSRTSFAAEAGGGLDLRLGGRWALRLVQADYRLTRLEGESDHWLRFSAGLVFTRRPK